MQDIVERIRKGSRTSTRWFRRTSRPLFRQFAPVMPIELDQIEQTFDTQLPPDLREWLLAMGYGDVDDTLSFRRDWMHTVKQGHLAGTVSFAQDELGNFFGYRPTEGSVIYFCRSGPEYAFIAPCFRAFMEELETRDFRLLAWLEELATEPYEWAG